MIPFLFNSLPFNAAPYLGGTGLLRRGVFPEVVSGSLAQDSYLAPRGPSQSVPAVGESFLAPVQSVPIAQDSFLAPRGPSQTRSGEAS